MFLLCKKKHQIGLISLLFFSAESRIVRTCTNETNRDIRLKELKSMLLSRSYAERLLDCALGRAKDIQRKVALKKAFLKKASKRGAFVTKYDPRLPSVGSTQAKPWQWCKISCVLPFKE